MKKKMLCLAGIAVVILICFLMYFQPLSFKDVIKENKWMDIILNEFEIHDGKPNIESLVYDSLTAEQNKAVFALLTNNNYRRTFGTLFSNGSVTDLDDRTLTIFMYDGNSSVSSIIVASSGKISVNDKCYEMENAEHLIQHIIEIVQ